MFRYLLGSVMAGTDPHLRWLLSEGSCEVSYKGHGEEALQWASLVQAEMETVCVPAFDAYKAMAVGGEFTGLRSGGFEKVQKGEQGWQKERPMISALLPYVYRERMLELMTCDRHCRPRKFLLEHPERPASTSWFLPFGVVGESWLEVKHSQIPNAGWGVFLREDLNEPLKKGEFVTRLHVHEQAYDDWHDVEGGMCAVWVGGLYHRCWSYDELCVAYHQGQRGMGCGSLINTHEDRSRINARIIFRNQRGVLEMNVIAERTILPGAELFALYKLSENSFGR